MTLAADDRIAITDLLNLHGHHADDGDLDAMHGLFTDNAVLDLTAMGMGVLTGHEQTSALARQIGDDNPVAHLITNIVLTQVGPDEVHARSKGIAIMRDGNAGSATYEDVVLRTGQGWRISNRRIIPRRVPLSGVHHQG